MNKHEPYITDHLLGGGAWESAELWALRYAVLVERINQENNDLQIHQVLEQSHSSEFARAASMRYYEKRKGL